MMRGPSAPFLIWILLALLSWPENARTDAREHTRSNRGFPRQRRGLRCRGGAMKTCMIANKLQLSGGESAAREPLGTSSRTEGSLVQVAGESGRRGSFLRDRGFVNFLLVFMAASTLVSYQRSFGVSASVRPSAPANDADYVRGMFYSFLALIGNSSVSACRKLLSREEGVGNAQQVGVASLLQGCGALAYSAATGGFATGLPTSFWLAAILSSRCVVQ